MTRLTADQRGFTHGVAYAAWCLAHTIGEPTTAADLCHQLNMTLADFERAGVDRDIVEVLRPEMELREARNNRLPSPVGRPAARPPAAARPGRKTRRAT